ncbi:hypothetical protein IRA69_03515 [Campylobacter hepaticus]|uniref:hypothetical protein n=1 Tax=Campylobacter hepaticus TaxID=1813019 RepID=UPI0018C18957|nr:hypothetical protein [Campylobacter hepaticus]MDX2323307.1 hypothetical protein [Campylobacter hepaticus]MDX2331152.1 hypothetical protein [Campylobacter hepaticus]MDX2332567.1 hypothetical protein [Campylobacter hepaticus]MDX2371767.1 hypothetical protein [Campylobacter hepaticus]MDX2397028.1 hypothetical protein [Campylobacter hepaticus]
MNIINSTLPLQIKVLAKSTYGHYTLLLNHKKIQTKSMIELEVGAQYLAELYMQNNGVMQFKHLCKCPNLEVFEEGLTLIIALLEDKISYKKFIIKNLLECKDARRYQILKEMLFASYENIYHIPFIFDNKSCLLQMCKKSKYLEIYLYFSVFGALKILIDSQGVSIFTPFAKVQKFLNKYLDFNITQENDIKPLFVFKKFFDFKG